MSRIIPLFPLNIVVFPGEKLNLHIFEPRYKQLVHDCLTTNSNFGMPSFFDNEVTEFGTELRLLSVEKANKSGELNIKSVGCKVFKLKEFQKIMPGRLYAGGEIEDFPNKQDEDSAIKSSLQKELHNLYKSLGIDNIFIPYPATFKAFQVAHHVGLSVAQEYQLLKMSKESERQEFLLRHLQKVVPVLKETERLKERIKQNGHFKHLIPPDF